MPSGTSLMNERTKVYLPAGTEVTFYDYHYFVIHPTREEVRRKYSFQDVTQDTYVWVSETQGGPIYSGLAMDVIKVVAVPRFCAECDNYCNIAITDLDYLCKECRELLGL
jgi:hypothetical protein